jgi:small subunit ribosomal protein S14
MAIKDWRKAFLQLKAKPVVLKKYMRHNAPKRRPTGRTLSSRCDNCGRYGGHISMYGISMCRQCFRELAIKIGFKKYN